MALVLAVDAPNDPFKSTVLETAVINHITALKDFFNIDSIPVLSRCKCQDDEVVTEVAKCQGFGL